MRKMKNTGLTKKELKDRIMSLLEELASLREGMDEEMSRDDFLTFLEEVIDTFSEGIEAADAIRVILLEGDDTSGKGAQGAPKEKGSEVDKDRTQDKVRVMTPDGRVKEIDGRYKKLLPEDLAMLIKVFTCLRDSAGKKDNCSCCPSMDGGTSSGTGDGSGVISSLDGNVSVTVLPDVAGQETDPSAVLSFGPDDLRVIPFAHILRICPWLNDRSVMRSVPGAKDVYYLFEEGSQIPIGGEFNLVGPVVMIKLNRDHFLASPNALDRHRVRKFLKDNTRSVVFEEGAAYPALRLV